MRARLIERLGQAQDTKQEVLAKVAARAIAKLWRRLACRANCGDEDQLASVQGMLVFVPDGCRPERGWRERDDQRGALIYRLAHLCRPGLPSPQIAAVHPDVVSRLLQAQLQPVD